MTASWPAPLAADPRVAEARRRLARGERVPLSGLVGPARLLVSLLAGGRPLLVVVAEEREVDGVVEDLGTLAREAGAGGAVLGMPAPGSAPFRGLPRHPDASLRRAAALHAALRGRLAVLVASPAGLLRGVLAGELFEAGVLHLRLGEERSPESVLEAAERAGYRREDPVTAPGQMARRGGILDLFPPDGEAPVRAEFLGDTIDSLRAFDPETQRTLWPVESLELVPLSDLFVPASLLAPLRGRLAARFARAAALPALLERYDRGLVPEETVELLGLLPDATVPCWRYLPGATVVALEPEAIRAAIEAFLGRAREDRERRADPLAPTVEEALVAAEALLERLATGPALELRELEARGAHLPARPVRRYAGDLRSLLLDLRARKGSTLLVLGNAGRAARVRDLLIEAGLGVGEGSGLEVRVGTLSRGFELPDQDLLVLADGDVFPEELHLHPRGRGRPTRSFLSDFRDLRVSDLVVHEDHGIGRFEGLETLTVGGVAQEFMVLGYRGGDKLKVPVDAFDRVQKHTQIEGPRPRLDRLGGGGWERVKRRVRRATQAMAAELLVLYAERKARPGHAFTASSPWQREFEESFEYEETPDQAAAIAAVAADMAAAVPMDRLICGDVGYGKTEVAMRAAMRAVLDGRQVAVLAPTTVLAFQHWKTFRRRFAPFPIRVEMLSRFRRASEIRETLAAVQTGAVDILIGTHRLLSGDVAFRELGLLVIDEEQRFGVAAKEKLKRMRTSVDCLTLSATPIPRTLHMGLAGLRDMSVIETPPKDRIAIQTSIVGFSTDVIAAVIRQELAREGQVYFVHNRVESIHAVAALVRRLVGEARVGVAHGQMREAELEGAMLGFVEGRTDVLVATTLIENGLDIPRVNTLLVNRADRMGLAQLYQLRGRVGRSDRAAYAYLLVPPEAVLSEAARKRLAAIREFSELGAGFRIAALDLEIRGAGNLLGGEQSGHIQAVGLDLYVKLLEEAILELRGEPPAAPAEASLNLHLDLRIPEAYVPEVNQRLSLYKRSSQARTAAELEALRAEIRDRYGPLPAPAETLLAYTRLRLRAAGLGILQIDRVGHALQLRFADPSRLEGRALNALLSPLGGAVLTPQGMLRVGLGGQDPLAALGALLSRLEAAVPEESRVGL